MFWSGVTDFGLESFLSDWQEASKVSKAKVDSARSQLDLIKWNIRFLFLNESQI